MVRQPSNPAGEGNGNDPPLLGVTIEYDYVNTIVALESKGVQEPHKVRLQAHLIIALDRLSSITN